MTYISYTTSSSELQFFHQDDPSIDEFLRMALGAIIARSNEFQPLNIAPWFMFGWINPPSASNKSSYISGWWQLKYFLFSPLFGEGSHFD